MAKPTELYARFAAVLAIEPDKDNRSLIVRLKDLNEQLYSLDFPEPLIGPLIIGLMSQAKAIAPDQAGGEPSAFPMTLDSGRPFSLPDGRIGLELTLESTVRLPVLFPKKAITILRAALDELDDLSKNAPPEKKPH